MIDVFTQSKIDILHPFIREEVRRLIYIINKTLTSSQLKIIDSFISFEEQKKLYEIGRTIPGNIITNSKPGQSLYNYGLSLSFCLTTDGKDTNWNDVDNNNLEDWLNIARLFQKEGYKLGKTINNISSFEKSKLNWKELLKRYDSQKVFKEKINGIVYKYVVLNTN